MKKIFLIIFVLNAGNLFAQTQKETQNNENLVLIQKNLENQEKEIERLIIKLNNQQIIISQSLSGISGFSRKVSNLEINIDSLNSQALKSERNINTIANNLTTKIQDTGQKVESKIIELDGNFEKNRLYWIIAFLATMLLLVLMYLFLGKRIKSSQIDFETQLQKTRKFIEEESLKLDTELVKVFQKQLEVIESASNGNTQNDDHSLVLKVADRLTAMETNLSRMDPNTRGLSNLKNIVKSTKENFSAKEYEIVDMLGKEYKDGMEVIATFIPSNEIEIGKQIITRIIKPQVNFKGQKIQAAQIEVSIGE
jgi:hypothetical protein